MPTTFEHKMRASRLAIAAVLVLSCALAPASAFASKGTAKIKDKKAARALIVTEIDRMKIDLQGKMDDLAETSSKIQETQSEVDAATTQLTQVQASLQTAHTELSERAAELYRSDRIGMVEMLLGSRNIEDLIVRTHYLMLISERDATMLNDYRLTQSEALWLQESLNRRMDRLRTLQSQSQSELAAINSDVTKAEAKALQIDADIATLLSAGQPTSSGSGTGTGTGTRGTRTSPDYNTLISSANFRSQDMTSGAIQTFLSHQSGTLDTYSAHDHAGNTKTAAQMIADAGKAWHISPRVILVTLEKEQSLVSMQNPAQKRYDWATGCGATDSGRISKYKGFGNQIWFCAKSLDANAKRFIPGTTLKVGSSTRHPTNSATWAFYKYTPHIHGNTMFWTIWWNFFNTNPTS